jgi:4-hydroxy-tetrahydrodipicolinate synthase
MKTELGRLITAMVTPFDEEGGVDYEQMKRLSLALLDSGSDGLLVSGTTGERPTLTDEEQLKLFGQGNGGSKRDGDGRHG